MPKTLDACNALLTESYARRPIEPARVLEAGGGSFTHFALPGIAELVPVDISHGQLVRNDCSDLRVQGDVQSLPLRPGCFGMAICFNVVEHLERPDQALRELCRTLAPGGLLLLGCPERTSLKGMVTRLTPLWFHQWYYRYAVGKEDRGEGHFDAFATPFKPIVSAPALVRLLSELGLEIVQLYQYDGMKEYGISSGNWRRRLFAMPVYILGALGWALSFGRWQSMASDILLVARKRTA